MCIDTLKSQFFSCAKANWPPIIWCHTETVHSCINRKYVFTFFFRTLCRITFHSNNTSNTRWNTGNTNHFIYLFTSNFDMRRAECIFYTMNWWIAKHHHLKRAIEEWNWDSRLSITITKRNRLDCLFVSFRMDSCDG